jgi:hypothetical protein
MNLTVNEIEHLAEIAYNTMAKLIFNQEPAEYIKDNKSSGHTCQNVPVLWRQLPESVKVKWHIVVEEVVSNIGIFNELQTKSKELTIDEHLTTVSKERIDYVE